MDSKIIDEEIKDKVVKLIQDHTQKEVSEILHITIPKVQKILKEKNLKLSKTRINLSHLKVDVNYFKEINSPKKAYWLGFICADGSINKNNSKLSFVVKDYEVLEKFKRDIKSEHRLSERSIFDKRTHKYYHRYELQITNNIFTRNIVSNGITNKKTDILEFPKISEDFYPYFIAGLFDGDGSVSLDKNNKRLRCNLISTFEVLTFIQDILYKKFDVKPSRLYRVTENKDNVYKLFLYADNAINFLDYIYQGDNQMYLSRKYNRYKENRNNEISRKRHQPVIAYDDNGNKIFTFSMMKEAEEKLNATWDGIHRSYVNNKKYKGYYWKYE